jgi:predicted dehydrogenase
MLMKLSKGAVGYASASFATPFARRPFEIHGTKGSLIIENSFAYLTGASEDSRPKLTIINQAGSSTRNYAPTECFRLEIEQFNRAIESQGEPMTTAADGVRILAMGEAFYDAVRRGRVARVTEFIPANII